MLNSFTEYKNFSTQIFAAHAPRCLCPKFRRATPSKGVERRPAPLETFVAGLKSHRGRCVKIKSEKDALAARPFTIRYGRRYLGDDSLPYPLPTDLAEAHRQTLRTLLLCQVFDGPLCSPIFKNEPPTSVLEVACGTGFWSEMCHRYFSERGHSSVKFTGIDIVPLAMSNESRSTSDMKWNFVLHDLRQMPLPFPDEEFSIVMIKDVSMAIPSSGLQQSLMDEYIRILKPGGTLEIWDGDHALRTLVPRLSSTVSREEEEMLDLEAGSPNPVGAYTVTLKTPLTPPRNPFLVEYNTWVAKALEARNLTAFPCATILPLLRQESHILEEIRSRRLAIPLGELLWEREGIGEMTAQTQSASKGKAKASMRHGKPVSSADVRRTALITVIQMIESLEPLLHEVSGKGEAEWDDWMSNMTSDFLRGDGASGGECLEVGAWWARKKKAP
ncbi:hypothetical protein K3495_g2006 [Podosphaera aphanis]|nr:hypothetical protein K3495_g2006 [Podosphaera aphanis]